MFAYEVSEWSDLFVAAAGAAAALAGLLFVAVSINLEPILALQGLAERALQALVMLAIVVAISLVGLIPGQSRHALGIELLVIAVAYSALLLHTSRRSMAGGRLKRSWVISRLLVAAAGAVPLMIGAVSVIAEQGGGLYWIGAGVLGAILGGIINAWVLLVEIHR